jgi:hypothetical protein
VEDGADVREGGEEVREGCVDVGRRKRLDGDVIDFDAVRKPADSVSRRIRMGNDDHL